MVSQSFILLILNHLYNLFMSLPIIIYDDIDLMNSLITFSSVELHGALLDGLLCVETIPKKVYYSFFIL